MTDHRPDLPDTNDDVYLDRGDGWEIIPPEIRRRIEEGRVRIGVLRAAIAKDARVRYMPPVSIDPALWTPDGTAVAHAAGGIWPSGNGGHEYGVVVSAGPAICRDDAIVRALLVHEFAHCFEIATRAIEHIDSGRGGTLELVTDNPLDRDREEELLAAGADWFGPGDAELIRWNDPRLKALTAEVVALANARQLPASPPPPRVHGTVVVPPEWAAHIRSLRRRRAP